MATLAPSKTGSPPMAIWKALLLTVPIALWSVMVLGQFIGSGDPLTTIAAVLVWVAFTVPFALMLITGQTHRYRSLVFIFIALIFPFNFIATMIEARGSMALTQDDLLSGGAAFCPMALPMIILPAVLTRTVIFPSALVGGYGVISMVILLVGVSLSIGRGWCSWGCFYGGWDEFFSRLLKKPRIKHIDRRLIYVPFAVLLAIVLTSAIQLGPTYCGWLCPFKVLTEFEAVTSVTVLIQTIIFVTLFIGLVIVLPLLSKRRIQCGLFCPFGAYQSLWNKINIFDVRIDPEKCIGCKRCIQACPTFSLDESSLESGKPLLTCTKCGKCVDTCPKGAISYHIKGTRVGVKPNVARTLYLYPAYILMSSLGAGIAAAGVWRILRLITTGSMI